MNKKLIIANWKMNPTSEKEAEKIFLSISSGIKNLKNKDVIICPPDIFLSKLKSFKNKKIILGAQDLSIFENGSHTGEISTKMLSDFGVSFVIVGHSERRAIGETNKIVNLKLKNILKNSLNAILCIGEQTRDNDGHYLSFIGSQLKSCLHDIPKSKIKNIIIAYEPIWAVGKDATREATPDEFVEVKIFIKKVLVDIYNAKVAQSATIIYGGSANPKNTKMFIEQGEADGVLVGRDSLNPKNFLEIINQVK